MITKLLERYDSEDGSFAEIERMPDGSITVSIYGSSFEPIRERSGIIDIEFARKAIEENLPKPYAKTI